MCDQLVANFEPWCKCTLSFKNEYLWACVTACIILIKSELIQWTSDGQAVATIQNTVNYICSKSLIFRRGSPLLIGIKSQSPLKKDRLPIVYSSGLSYSVILVHIIVFSFPYLICVASKSNGLFGSFQAVDSS